MSKLFSRIAGLFTSRAQVGVDKAGNRYFARKEEVDGIMKEKRWVLFKGEDDPTSIPVLKKEEEERRAKEGTRGKPISIGKVGGPDLKSFIQQFPTASEGGKVGEASGPMDGLRDSQEKAAEKEKLDTQFSEPTGSGQTFRPGTWQPPT
ncbi:NADH dehydrogenase [ubiquinone] 1 alpha subcomplex subunit 12 [Quillaja saponaria]|uniref:NADH dehydrogenase [ubiquinone] 1 alpha subcomplex subunit 12 n=1 Tax=Quillaja saponaria TaxID=32244 RepID=A0AAD7LUV6_QUISA|nr:NADH dehydrogenase [ubiquinone] 1 alpha subcomplex subunit 12 [Quillaja saponaria]